MFRFLIISSCLYFFAFASSFAQEVEEENVPQITRNSPKKYALGVTYGFGGLVVRDRVISNFLYQGTYMPIGLHFEGRERYSKYSFSIEFMNSPVLKTKTNDGFSYKGDLGQFFPDDTNGLDHSTLKTRMNSTSFTSLYMLRKSEPCKIRTYLGFDLNSANFYKKFLQFEYVNELRDRIVSAGFVANFERNFNAKHLLEYNLSVPIISYAKRSLFNNNSSPSTVESSHISILSRVIGFDSRFTYRFQLASRFSLRATYEFHYLQVSFPYKEQWAYNQFVIGAFLHF